MYAMSVFEKYALESGDYVRFPACSRLYKRIEKVKKRVLSNPIYSNKSPKRIIPLAKEAAHPS